MKNKNAELEIEKLKLKDELEKNITSKPYDISIKLPPYEDLDDDGNYIGNDPEFL